MRRIELKRVDARLRSDASASAGSTACIDASGGGGRAEDPSANRSTATVRTRIGWCSPTVPASPRNSPRVSGPGETAARWCVPGASRTGREGCNVDPTSAEDYRRLLIELRQAGHAIDGVVHAWSLDSGAWDGMSER